MSFPRKRCFTRGKWKRVENCTQIRGVCGKEEEAPQKGQKRERSASVAKSEANEGVRAEGEKKLEEEGGSCLGKLFTQVVDILEDAPKVSSQKSAKRAAYLLLFLDYFARITCGRQHGKLECRA